MNISWKEEKILTAEYVKRPLENMKEMIGPLAHHGVRVYTAEGNQYLIHSGPEHGIVVTDAKNMSEQWSVSHKIPIHQSLTVQEALRSGSGVSTGFLNWLSGGTCIGSARAVENALSLPTNNSSQIISQHVGIGDDTREFAYGLAHHIFRYGQTSAMKVDRSRPLTVTNDKNQAIRFSPQQTENIYTVLELYQAINQFDYKLQTLADTQFQTLVGASRLSDAYSQSKITYDTTALAYRIQLNNSDSQLSKWLTTYHHQYFIKSDYLPSYHIPQAHAYAPPPTFTATKGIEISGGNNGRTRSGGGGGGGGGWTIIIPIISFTIQTTSCTVM